MVFTIPKRLRIFFRYDRKLLGELAGCAWRALKLYFDGTFDGADVTPGAAGFLQTSGELLNFHPHVHVLVTPGWRRLPTQRLQTGLSGSPSLGRTSLPAQVFEKNGRR